MSAASGTSEPVVQKVKSTGTASTPGQEFAYPRGHLGHLNADEEDALRNFKLVLQEDGLYKPGPPAASHDDPTLLRFLRARRWVVQDAHKQFKDTEQWRAANQLDVLYDTIDLNAYEQSRILYPQWTGRRDRRGIPLYVFEIRHLDSKTISNYEKLADKTYSKARADGSTSSKLVRLLALYENLTRFVHPLCTNLTDRPHSETPITLSTNIVDVSGVSLRQFWNLKSHMQAASQLATAHYPETLDRIFIIGAPMFFGTVWGWIKRWFDPNTVSKIFILGSHEVKSTLQEYIDPKNIPKQYGGELEFGWGDAPTLDPKIRETATWENGYTTFPGGPVYWQPVDNGERLECIAVGSINQQQRLERVCTIPHVYKTQLANLPEVATGSAQSASASTDGSLPTVAAATAAEVGSEKLAAAVPANTDSRSDSTATTTRVDSPTSSAVSTNVNGVSVNDLAVTNLQEVQNLSIADTPDINEKTPVDSAPEQAQTAAVA